MKNWNNKYQELVQCVKEHNLKIYFVRMDLRYEVLGDVSKLSPYSLVNSFYRLLKFDDPFVPTLLELRNWDEETQIIEYRFECYIFVSPILFRFSDSPSKNSRYGKPKRIPLLFEQTDPFFRGTTPGFDITERSWRVGKVYHFEAMTNESNLAEFWEWFSQVPKKGKETQDEWMGRYFNYLNPGMFFYSGHFMKEDYLQAWFESWVWEGERSPLVEVDLSSRAMEERGSTEFKQWALNGQRSLAQGLKGPEKERELELVRKYEDRQQTK